MRAQAVEALLNRGYADAAYLNGPRNRGHLEINETVFLALASSQPKSC
jgi:hypothetical protein